MEHHHSLAGDIETMLNMTASRRQSLRWLFATAALPIAGCGTASVAATTTTSTTPTTGSPGATCAVIPEETGGPYPGDGTALQIASVSGSPAAGYVATLTVGVSA